MTQSLVVGIDIGGTNTSFGLVNRRGEIVSKGRISTKGHSTPGDFVSTLVNAILPLIEIEGKDSIAGVGIGAPNGNFFTGEIVFAPNLEWRGVIPMAQL